MEEPRVLAFFPWASLREPLSVGNLRLIPYEVGNEKNNLEHVSSSKINSILSAYSNNNRKITSTTLLEIGNWKSGMPASEELIRNMFRVRSLIVMSGLSKRKLFSTHQTYCNAGRAQI